MPPKWEVSFLLIQAEAASRLGLILAIGVAALITFWTAAALRKGSPLHLRVGQGYLLAMLGIIVTAMPMAWVMYLSGRTVTATFLAYLVVITAAGVWSQWRAIRDQNDAARYTGSVYVGLGVLPLLSGLGVLLLSASRWARRC